MHTDTRPTHHPEASPPSPGPTVRRLLISAGPTHEPIDDVRYIANRSSGRLGIELAETAATDGWDVTLLLGPTSIEPRHSTATACHVTAPTDTTPVAGRFHVIRFRTTEDLQSLLRAHSQKADVLVMAAAVADYRPKTGIEGQAGAPSKIRRSDKNLILELEPTPDLLAECAKERKRSGKPTLIVGFALEARDGLLEAAASKLARKGVDLIVANPLETMDSESIEATILDAGGVIAETGGRIPKTEFASWLLGHLRPRLVTDEG